MGMLVDFLIGLLLLTLSGSLLALEIHAVTCKPLIIAPLMLATLIGMGLAIQGLWEDLHR